MGSLPAYTMTTGPFIFLPWQGSNCKLIPTYWKTLIKPEKYKLASRHGASVFQKKKENMYGASVKPGFRGTYLSNWKHNFYLKKFVVPMSVIKCIISMVDYKLSTSVWSSIIFVGCRHSDLAADRVALHRVHAFALLPLNTVASVHDWLNNWSIAGHVHLEQEYN